MQNTALSKGDSFSSLLEAYYTASLEKLVPAPVFSTWQNLLADLSKDISPFWGYEVPLGDDNITADFLFCLDNAAFLVVSDKNKIFTTHYPGISDFTGYWNLHSNNIKNIWFEFDHRQVFKGNLTPAFFFAPHRSLSGLELVHLVDEVFETLFKETMDRETLRHLLHCWKSLDNRAWIPQIGRMVSRGEKNLRLFIQDITPGTIPAYLEKIGYLYAQDHRLHEMLSIAYQAANHVHLDIDITEVTGDTIGLECYFQSVRKAFDFLVKLNAMEFCGDMKLRSLENYLKTLKFDESKPYQNFLSHIKLVFRHDSGFSAKIYLGFACNEQARNIIRTAPLNPNPK